MKSSRLAVRAFCGLMMTLPLARAVYGAEADEAVLAEHVAALADRFDNSATYADAKERLYEAAGRLAEKEVRYRRLRYRSAATLGDSEGMLAALTEWRKLEPENLFVQMRLIDAYLTKMETADAKLKYVRAISDTDSVNGEVRSYAAIQSARVMMEQSRNQQAYEMVRMALVLNPLNTEALQLQWQLTAGVSTPLQRVGQLLAMLRANPSSVDATLYVADELAIENMVPESLQWYGQAATMTKSVGGLTGESAKNYVAELLIGGQDRQAGELLARILERNDSDPGAWFLTLLAERGMKDRIDQVKKNALIGLLNHLAEARQAIGVRHATTRPLGSDDVNLPDLSGDVALAEKASAAAQRDYVGAVSDVAWFLVFNEDRPKDAQAFVDVIRKVDESGKVLIGRLDGWTLLKSGKLDEAKVKLAAVADSDPLAQLGLIRIQRQDGTAREAVADAARKLIRQYPSRLVGAIIRAEVGDIAGDLPREAVADAIKDLLDRFPRELMRLPQAPQEFLSLRLSPLQVGHDFGEPVLMDVELHNLQDMPLVVGRYGVAKDVWMDVQTRGLETQVIPGVVFEPVDGPLKLASGGTIHWVTRVDRGPLAELLERNVLQPMQFSVMGTTNAVPTEAGIVAGPCGIRTRTTPLIERRSGSLISDSAIRKAHEIAAGSDPIAKFRIADEAAAHLRLLTEPEPPQGVKPLEGDLRALLDKLGQDGEGTVRVWARYQSGQAQAQPEEKVVQELAKDELWYGRLLAASAALGTSPDIRNKALKDMESDADVTVRRLAAALASVNVMPQTNPAR